MVGGLAVVRGSAGCGEGPRADLEVKLRGKDHLLGSKWHPEFDVLHKKNPLSDADALLCP